MRLITHPESDLASATATMPIIRTNGDYNRHNPRIRHGPPDPNPSYLLISPENRQTQPSAPTNINLTL
jgi:hypothetical protein